MIDVHTFMVSVKRATAALLLIAALIGPMIGKVKAESSKVSTDKTEAETAGVMSGINEEVVEDISSPTPDYAIKLQEIAKYKELLIEKGCQEINLEICAAGLYARNKSDGFKDPRVFDQWKKTILGDYITDEQIYEFGRTGKGLDVIYFRDKNGKKTKEPAIFYVTTPDVKKFKISDIEKAIAFWEKVAPGFLRAIVANDTRFLFQGQASSNKKIKVFKYEWGIIYFNFSDNDSEKFDFGLRRGLPLESFGLRAEALGIFSKNEVGVIKSWLTRDCCVYIAKKTGNKNVLDRVKSYQSDLDDYMASGNFIYEYMSPIIERIKKEGLVTPFGAETWEEIDSIKK